MKEGVDYRQIKEIKENPQYTDGIFTLLRPDAEWKVQYEEMMDEWEAYGGRLNPGALRRYSNRLQRTVTYEEWLQWIEEDRAAGQDLYFFVKGNELLGAISIRFKDAGNIRTDGHCGFGIRPSCRRLGYATHMLSMALPIFDAYGISPILLSCAKDNIGSAKTICKNGGQFIEEILEDESGEWIQMYQISR